MFTIQETTSPSLYRATPAPSVPPPSSRPATSYTATPAAATAATTTTSASPAAVRTETATRPASGSAARRWASAASARAASPPVRRRWAPLSPTPSRSCSALCLTRTRGASLRRREIRRILLTGDLSWFTTSCPVSTEWGTCFSPEGENNKGFILLGLFFFSCLSSISNTLWHVQTNSVTLRDSAERFFIFDISPPPPPLPPPSSK